MCYSITSNETYLVQGVNEAYSFCSRGKIKESAEQRTAGVGICVCLAEAEKIACITKKNDRKIRERIGRTENPKKTACVSNEKLSTCVYIYIYIYELRKNTFL